MSEVERPPLYDRLYSQLSAIECLSVGHGAPYSMNRRGERILRYLRARRRRQP